ncbi:MAG: hypothetical protein C5B50_09280 [Verrucomicrobia bacterium]|nr:MAG: hypothetical protein C5B50_09280 [Verrucomicrobiota bacterium]
MQQFNRKPANLAELAIGNWQLAIPTFLFALSSVAATFQDDFSSDPATRGWKAFGNTNLFQWDSTNQNLRATWDSSQSNSYFYHPLPATLTTNDAFLVQFDIQLSDIQWTGVYEVSVGLLNLADATSTNFSRALGNSPDLLEFDYFPDDGAGTPNIAATLTDASNGFFFIYDNLPMNLGVTYRVQLLHYAGETNIHSNVLTNGQRYTSMPLAFANPTADFRLDTFAVSSYSAAGDTYGDSILAKGTIDNVLVTDLPVQNMSGSLSNTVWHAQFTAQTNWLYTLERTADLRSWTPILPAAPGITGSMILSDTNAPPGNALYRIRADRQ